MIFVVDVCRRIIFIENVFPTISIYVAGTSGNIEQNGKHERGGAKKILGNTPPPQMGGKQFFSKDPSLGFSENNLYFLLF